MIPRTSAWMLSLLLCSVACDDRVDQCNALVQQLNPHTEAMIRGVEALGRAESDPSTLVAWEGIVDAADRDLSVLALQDAKLAGFALRYRRQLADARQVAGSLRTAIEQHDPQGLHAAAERADAFLDAQASILAELNAYCGGDG